MFQEYENFRTHVMRGVFTLAGMNGCLQMTHRLSVDIPMTPNGQEFLLPLCPPNTGQVSQITLNPAKIRDVIQYNKAVAIQSTTEGKKQNSTQVALISFWAYFLKTKQR